MLKQQMDDSLWTRWRQMWAGWWRTKDPQLGGGGPRSDFYPTRSLAIRHMTVVEIFLIFLCFGVLICYMGITIREGALWIGKCSWGIFF